LDERGSIANKDEEKAEVLNAFLSQSLTVKLVIPRVVRPQCWKIGKESETNLPQSRRKQLTTCYATRTLTSLWGQMGSTQEC